MIFVTGPLLAGKEAYIRRTLHLTQEEFSQRGVRDAEKLAADAEDLDALADRLAQREIVIASEVGCGVVPADPEERAFREAAGRLACLLAERADTVVRVCCGLPQVLKGEPPC